MSDTLIYPMSKTMLSHELRIAKVVSTKDYIPTAEQLNVIRTVTGEFYKLRANNGRTIVVVTAVAGAGKTETVVDIYKVIADDLGQSRVQFIAFSVKSRDELVKRGISGKHARTLNGLGHSNLSYFAKGRGLTLEVNDSKNVTILRNLSSGLAKIGPARRFAAKLMSYIKAECLTNFTRDRLESLADDYGLFLDVSFDECRTLYGCSFDELEKRVYAWTADAMTTGNIVPTHNGDDWVIDYDDQIYLPIILKIKCFENDLIIVDEAQDLSIANKKLVNRCLKKNGVLVLVGDDYQCIFAWRGCPVDGLEATLSRSDLNTIHTPLTFNFRSCHEIIDNAAVICPAIKCGTGRYGMLRTIERKHLDVTELNGDIAILSRTRAPLIGFAIECLKADVPFTFRISLGFLKTSIAEATAENNDLSIRAFRRRWNAHVTAKQVQYKIQDADQALDELEDTNSIIETLLDRLTGIDKVRDLLAEIDTLEAHIRDSDGSLCLSTIHGSKGLEWAITYVIGYDTIGNGCRRDWQTTEARNLRLVAVTRAKDELVFVNEKKGDE